MQLIENPFYNKPVEPQIEDYRDWNQYFMDKLWFDRKHPIQDHPVLYDPYQVLLDTWPDEKDFAK